MFKNIFIGCLKRIAMIALCLTFIMFFALPTYAADSSSDNDPVKLTAGFIKDAEITVENDNVVLFKTTNISGNDYRAETVCLIPKEGKTANDLLAEIGEYGQRASGSQYNDQFDGSYSVKGWVQVYYQTMTFPRGQGMKVTHVDGGYTRYDNSVHVIKQAVDYGCSGHNASTGNPLDQGDYQNPTANSWSYYTSAWQYVLTDYYCTIGGGCEYTLRRGTGNNTWSFYVDCTVL